MCRIAGIIDKNHSSKYNLLKVKAMCDDMAHGGPDGEGFFEAENSGLSFGHRRLALIDLSPGGKQPMSFQERYTITFNGEIYNYLVIKKELEKLGVQFTSKSDTEVILAGFATWGTAVFEKLSGMFAFALYDNEKEETFLVRDSAGIKPLYYTIQDEALIFASEVKSFENLSIPENPDWKIYFLAFGHIPEPFTTLDQVYMLSKGHYLHWNNHTVAPKIIAFHKETYSHKIDNEQDAKKVIADTLLSAVDRHLISDAPIGVFLSGGIDSSILTLLANEIQLKARQPLHTISINFENSNLSEEEYQDIIVNQVTGTHISYSLNEEIFNEHFPTAVEAMDQPTADGLNSWFVNYFAKKNGLKAVLSGIGGDELFGGYPSFKRINLMNILSLLPSLILNGFLKIKQPLLKRAAYLSYKNSIGEYLFLRGFFTADEIAKILDTPLLEVNNKLKNLPAPIIPKHLKAEEKASWLETNYYMQNQLLKDTDFMSMQHGVEVRVPFLDKDLIKKVHEISNGIKYKTGFSKGLLIDSFKDILPEKIWNRKKMGFSFPFQKWLQENQYFLQGLSKCNNVRGKELISDFGNGKLHWSKAFALYHIFGRG